MWIRKLETRGLDGVDTVEWDRIGTLPTAAIDALALATVHGSERHRHWLEWEAEEDGEIYAIGRPDQVLRIRSDPRVKVAVEIIPDPPLFGKLRHRVLSQPALAAGLAAGSLTLDVRWAFSPGGGLATPEPVRARLGDLDVPLNEGDWVGPLAEEVLDRIVIVDWREPFWLTVQHLGVHLLGADPVCRARAQQAIDDLDELGIPAQMLHHGTFELGVGPTLAPLRRLGPHAELVIRAVVAARVTAPDVLVLPWSPDPGLASWLSSCTEGDDAVLEQVLWV